MVYDWSDPELVRRVVCLVTCVGLAISSLEWLVPPEKVGASGLLSGASFEANRLEQFWRRHGLRLTFVARFVGALAFIVFPTYGVAVFVAGLLSLPLRMRGPLAVFTGMDGAEHLMTSVSLVLGATFLVGSPIALEAALVFVALQAMLEYASSGWTKLRAWRGWASGLYLRQAFASSNYGCPPLEESFAKRPSAAQAVSIAVVALEIMLPFAVLLPQRAAELLLLGGVAFHVVTAFIMGLNTFVWAFCATYPAILHCRALLDGR